MKFTEHRDSQINMIKHYSPGQVTVNDQPIEQSCIVTQSQLFTDWAVKDLASLNEQHIERLLALEPEVLLLGVGEDQVFPESKVFAQCARAGLSLEVMNNASACRTYNVLTTEERIVVLGLIISAD